MKICLTGILWILCCLYGAAQTCSIPEPDTRCMAPASFDFISRQSGNWTSGSTWVGGVAPSVENINNQQIKITHDVTVQDNNIKLDNNSVIYITEGGRLTLRNGNLYLEDGNQSTTEKLLIDNGFLRTSGNVQQNGSATVICANNASLEIGDEDASATPSAFTSGLFNSGNSNTAANFQNTNGYRRLENVCLNVTQDMQNDGGKDEFIGVCAEIGDQGPFSGPKNNNGGGNSRDGDDSGNFQVQSATGTSTKIYNSEFYIPNGNLQNSKTMIICNSDFRLTDGSVLNQSDANINGQDIVIWINNSSSGNIINPGTWPAATISAWRTDNTNQPIGLPGLTAESSAAIILTHFNDCTCSLIPLPVKLLNFEGKRIKNGILLTWKTASEENNDRFEIERSRNGLAFEKIGIAAGKGSSGILTAYTYSDNFPDKQLLYYRLKQVDLDGSATFSPIITIDFRAVQNIQLQLYPNPCKKPNCRLQISHPNTDQPIRVELRDLAGKILFIQMITEENVAKTKLLHLDLLPGIYLLFATDGSSAICQKVIIQP